VATSALALVEPEYILYLNYLAMQASRINVLAQERASWSARSDGWGMGWTPKAQGEWTVHAQAEEPLAPTQWLPVGAINRDIL
jgi:hypothetical protein